MAFVQAKLLPMSETLELATVKSGPVAIREPMTVPTVAQMLSAVVERGVTSENVAAVREMAQLLREEKAADAKRAFAEAFVKLQREIPKIRATKTIPDRNGGVRSSFAPFEEIDAQARPICLANGFTYSFSEGESPQGKITKICTLTHIGGHERSNPYTVRIGSGPPGCSESQSDGSAHSYAKRGALCDCLNIIVAGMDNDARAEGGTIPQAKAADLQERLRNVDGDEKAFLKFAGADCFEKISAVKLDMIEQFLEKKERLKMKALGAK